MSVRFTREDELERVNELRKQVNDLHVEGIMTEKIYETAKGKIHYWVNEDAPKTKLQLVFLPGLTADHRLFNKQVEFFKDKYSVFVWDAPGHASSYPFEMTFSLMDKAKWLDEILKTEGFDSPVIIGQSMGGYLGQMYHQLFPEKIKGFISVDSAPLKIEYMTKPELWLLHRMEPVYKWYPWKALLRDGTSFTATSEYGRKLMHDIMMVYDGDKPRYAKLVGHGYQILADAIEARLPYDITCPALLICGDKDRAGSTMRYNKAWTKKSGIPIEWIRGAGHNSNTDEPETINGIIQDFVGKITVE